MYMKYTPESHFAQIICVSPSLSVTIWLISSHIASSLVAVASAQLSTCMLLFGPGVIADRLQTVLMDASVVRGVLRTNVGVIHGKLSCQCHAVWRQSYNCHWNAMAVIWCIDDVTSRPVSAAGKNIHRASVREGKNRYLRWRSRNLLHN